MNDDSTLYCNTDDLRHCPRCDGNVGLNAERCDSCGLNLSDPYDPTAGHPEGSGYLNRLIAGHLRIISILAYGGNGMVFLVRHTKLKQRNLFALKFLLPELAQDAEFRLRFLREAEIVYAFSHPNIIPIREFAETEAGEMYFTMDFSCGMPLDEALKEKQDFSCIRTLTIAEHVLHGLEYAHRHDIVHRDLKPGNIFLEETRHGEMARILDFGISKPINSKGFEVTSQNKILGTPAYMAPEQINGEALDGRTDLYALGVILYRMISGQPPFKAKTPHQLMAFHLQNTPRPLDMIKTDVPKGLSYVVEKLMSKRREDRYSSAGALLEEIGKLKKSLESGGPGTEILPKPPRKTVLKRVLLAGFLLGMIGGGGYFLGFTPPGKSILNAISEFVRPSTNPDNEKPSINKDTEKPPANPDAAKPPNDSDRIVEKKCQACGLWISIKKGAEKCPRCGNFH